MGLFSRKPKNQVVAYGNSPEEALEKARAELPHNYNQSDMYKVYTESKAESSWTGIGDECDFLVTIGYTLSRKGKKTPFQEKPSLVSRTTSAVASTVSRAVQRIREPILAGSVPDSLEYKTMKDID